MITAHIISTVIKISAKVFVMLKENTPKYTKFDFCHLVRKTTLCGHVISYIWKVGDHNCIPWDHVLTHVCILNEKWLYFANNRQLYDILSTRQQYLLCKKTPSSVWNTGVFNIWVIYKVFKIIWTNAYLKWFERWTISSSRAQGVQYLE